MVGELRPPSETHLQGLPGYHPNNLQPWITSVGIVVTVLGAVSVAMRLWSRYLTSMKLWWDDFLIVWSGAWALTALYFMFAMKDLGLGLHVDVVDAENVDRLLKWLVVSETLYAWSLAWTKLSVLMMYYRIFRISYFKPLAWAAGALIMVWVLSVTFLYIFTCVPVEKLWHTELDGHCISQSGVYVGNGISSIVTDVLILLLPIPQLWRLQLKKSAKIGVFVMFGLGFFVVFASSYRISVLLLLDKSDSTYTLAPTVGWTAIEISSAFISANIPTFLPILAPIGRCLGIRRRTTTTTVTSWGSVSRRTQVHRMSGWREMKPSQTAADGESGQPCTSTKSLTAGSEVDPYNDSISMSCQDPEYHKQALGIVASGEALDRTRGSGRTVPDGLIWVEHQFELSESKQ